MSDETTAGTKSGEELFEEFSRRHFMLNSATLLLGGVTAGGAVFSSMRFLSPPEMKEELGGVELNEADLKPGEATFFKFRNKPALIVSTDTGYVALSAVCTHLGCIVKWKADDKIFECPCHGGRYDITGKNISGPPPAPLEQLTVAVNQGKITIGKKKDV